MRARKLPRNLYKYCSFGVNSLGLLSNEEVYYANPQSFNDPLDCDPTVQLDTDRASIEKLCIQMLAAAYGKPHALKAIADHQHMSTEYGNYNTDHKAEEYYVQRLGSEIKLLLDGEMAWLGVLCMAERWDSPLMWSHYADKHRGLCIEYDLTENACPQIKPVDYSSPRSIKVTELMQWKFHKSAEAEQSVRDTYFFAKSSQWRYEKEWRHIHPSHGVSDAPFKISGVYFHKVLGSGMTIDLLRPRRKYRRQEKGLRNHCSPRAFVRLSARDTPSADVGCNGLPLHEPQRTTYTSNNGS